MEHSGMPPIVAKTLSKVYPAVRGRAAVRAVEEVGFTCPQGEVFGLLGPNGAGKTTTLRMLSSLLVPTSGTAHVAGFDVRHHPHQVRARIGCLSGSTALYPRLTVRETLAFFGTLHGVLDDELDLRIETIADRLELTPWLDRRVEELSTGTAQKTNLARTLLHDPPVLILDEPTSGLDVLAASATIDFIAERKAEGKAILFSTHILDEAERLCDLIGVLCDGRLFAVGTLDELRERTGRGYLDEIFKDLVTGARA